MIEVLFLCMNYMSIGIVNSSTILIVWAQPLGKLAQSSPQGRGRVDQGILGIDTATELATLGILE